MQKHTRICFSCKIEKALSFYHKDKTRLLGHSYECRDCVNKRTTLFRKDNTAYKRKQKDAKFKRCYDYSLFEYEEQCIKQDNKCLICKDTTNLYVDHNHTTGKVRGLLCSNCNTAIGLLKDSSEVLIRASEYLKERGSYGMNWSETH